MPGRYSLRGRAKPTGFYNEDYDPLKPQTSAARAKKALAKRKAKTATKAPAKATAKTTKNAAAKKEDEIPKDLDKSFIGKYKPELIRPPKRQTWKHDGDTPITDIKQAPTGWTSHDADLDPNDIDAQIERCHERIKAGIMPSIFEARLKDYLVRKYEREDMMNEEAEHLTWNVVQRLDDLENIRTWLEKSDDDEQIPNVDAIMNAYTRGDLEWHAGLVTYWSNGEQLCQPRPFKWDEFQAIGAKHKGHIGFWVEGGPKVGQVLLQEIKPSSGTSNGNQNGLLSPPSPAAGPNSHVDVRLNDTVQSHPFSYIQDAGAHVMSITERDFAYLHKVSVTIDGFDPKPAASMGVTRVHMETGGEMFWRSKALQIKFQDPAHPQLAEWEWVQCHLSEARDGGAGRIPDLGQCVLYRDTMLWRYGPREGINRKPQVY